MKKLVSKVVISLALATGVGAVVSPIIAPTQSVQAVSKHSWKYHWIKLKKDKKIIRVNTNQPRYKWHAIDAIILEKGSEVRARYFSNDHYYQIKASDLQDHGTWIVRGKSTSWFKND